MSSQSLLWVPNTDSSVLRKMLQHKIDLRYIRPSRLDVEAQKAIIISKRSTCMFHEVGAVIFHVEQGNHFHLSDGYNGASKGDVDPREAGCARVVDGHLHEGQGKCRGSHAELNAIGNCPVDTSRYVDVRMMVTLHPCYSCAKQIVNRSIKTIYYLWEYGRDEGTAKYFQDLGITVMQYTSEYLEKWIKVNNYDPALLRG